MSASEIYHLLKSRNIWHEVTEDRVVYRMAEASALALPYPEADAKNRFVRDEKNRLTLS